MEELTYYGQHILIFFIFAISGVALNLINLWYKNAKLTPKRIVREITTGLWISIIGTLILDNFVEWKHFALYAIGSIMGYLGSIIVGKLDKDLVEALLIKILKFIKEDKEEDELH